MYNLALFMGKWEFPAAFRPGGRSGMGLRLTQIAALPRALPLALAALLLAFNPSAFAFGGQAVPQAQEQAANPAPNPRQLFQEAQEAEQRGDQALAVSKYQELLRLHPEIVAAHADLAVVLVSLGRYDEAIREYHVALAQAPDSPPLRLDLGLAYYKKGDLAGAAAQFAALHKEQPGNVRIATLLGNCEVQLGLVGEALALLQPLEKNNPDNLDLEWALGTGLIRAGQTLDGLKRVQKVAEQGHNEKAYQLAADLYLGLTFFDIAKRDAEAVLRMDPKAVKAYVVLGMVDDYAGNPQAAEQEYNKALQIDPNDLQSRLQLADDLFQERKLDAVRQQIDMAFALDPNSLGARYELARVERAEGKLEAAVKDFESVAQQNPNWLEPHVELAALYFRLKRPQDGARERQIVDRLRAQEQKRRGQARIISPHVPPQ